MTEWHLYPKEKPQEGKVFVINQIIKKQKEFIVEFPLGIIEKRKLLTFNGNNWEQFRNRDYFDEIRWKELPEPNKEKA